MGLFLKDNNYVLQHGLFFGDVMIMRRRNKLHAIHYQFWADVIHVSKIWCYFRWMLSLAFFLKKTRVNYDLITLLHFIMSL